VIDIVEKAFEDQPQLMRVQLNSNATNGQLAKVPLHWLSSRGRPAGSWLDGSCPEGCGHRQRPRSFETTEPLRSDGEFL
jgi:hypothetical protein